MKEALCACCLHILHLNYQKKKKHLRNVCTCFNLCLLYVGTISLEYIISLKTCIAGWNNVFLFTRYLFCCLQFCAVYRTDELSHFQLIVMPFLGALWSDFRSSVTSSVCSSVCPSVPLQVKVFCQGSFWLSGSSINLKLSTHVPYDTNIENDRTSGASVYNEYVLVIFYLFLCCAITPLYQGRGWLIAGKHV